MGTMLGCRSAVQRIPQEAGSTGQDFDEAAIRCIELREAERCIAQAVELVLTQSPAALAVNVPIAGRSD